MKRKGRHYPGIMLRNLVKSPNWVYWNNLNNQVYRDWRHLNYPGETCCNKDLFDGASY